MVGDKIAACKHQVVRPDPDEVLAENKQSLTDAFFNDPTGTNMSKLFATQVGRDMLRHRRFGRLLPWRRSLLTALAA